ncbi:MAG: TlpA disulfide reductase family protein [Prolixibacteraceae bacterium]|nr:AhpC/TSA family protein [Prolixibacteraceae bacterium]MDI9562736.1 TlpA disulfide reductase family protein [Bacteroidota bacterium]NLS99681.1 AhpC/TSA family protein [Bacteroidales bacterium]OQB81736.1 MAG: Thiol-disulfide oxidoreductase ResA [Bacteroidetes bacterium ADurb.Bin123]HNZ67744.1 TlpA disulfide reductase family protein [Prolixibacteraceae bacterium]
MRRLTYITFWVTAILIFGCSRPEKFEIKGRITNSAGRKIFLEELMVASVRPVDSAKISASGEFTMKQHTGMPTFYLLKLSENNFITLLIDSAEKVTIEADAINFARDYKVNGSPGSLLVQELNNRLNTTKQKLDSISSLYSLYAETPEIEDLKKEWKAAYDTIVKQQVAYSTAFVSEHPFSMASVLALYQKFNDDNYVVRDLYALRVAASALNSFYPNSEHVKALYANTLQLLATERAGEVRRLINESGMNSPEIVLPDPRGNKIALSSFRGKYVLVHFWSAVESGSRIVNPVLVEIYQKYKNKGFEIYQVSVDKDRTEWLEAIDQDKMVWTQVGDMEGSIQAVMHYNIQSVPFNYLLDKDGNIIAKNLTGPAIDRTLAAIFR